MTRKRAEQQQIAIIIIKHTNAKKVHSYGKFSDEKLSGLRCFGDRGDRGDRALLRCRNDHFLNGDDVRLTSSELLLSSSRAPTGDGVGDGSACCSFEANGLFRVFLFLIQPIIHMRIQISTQARLCICSSRHTHILLY